MDEWVDHGSGWRYRVVATRYHHDIDVRGPGGQRMRVSMGTYPMPDTVDALIAAYEQGRGYELVRRHIPAQHVASSSLT